MSREMKNSGIPWIGEIPKDWTVVPFKSVVTNVTTGLNPRDNFELSKDDELYYVTIRNFKDGKLYLDDNCDKIDRRAWEIIQSRSDLRKGDILFASISKDAQCYILDDFPHNWNINESVFALRGNYSLIYDKYLYYSLINPEYYNDLRLDATGTTFQSIKQKKLKESLLLLPRYTEQQKIASFLDRKCSEIDKLIALQEQIVEELNAYKQSVITEAVTKGLNPYVPMKDSGIEWIGEIPEHWEVVRLKGVATVQRGGSPRPIEEYLSDEGYNWIKIGDTTKGDKYIRSVKQKIKEEGVSKSRKVYKGDLILTNSMSFGEPYILQVDGCIHDGWVAFSNISRVDKEFLYYFFFSSLCKLQFNLQVAGGVVQNLNVDKISSTQIVLPLETEQRAIVDYLDNKCTEIDNLISIKQSKIDSLNEYKKSIIYEYVTGKKEIE